MNTFCKVDEYGVPHWNGLDFFSVVYITYKLALHDRGSLVMDI